VLRWHRDHPDSGVHSASGWALRQWGERLPNLSEPSRRLPLKSRNWWPHELGFTMLRISGGEFTQVDDDNRETKRKVRLGEYWISDREVTVELYQRFLDDKSETAKPIDPEAADTRVSPTPDHPMQKVSWFDAVLFCNWLSRREGRTPCYACVRRSMSGTRDEGGEWDVIVDPAGNGYRLLTEAEWEYACRGGSSTEFCFGNSEGWLTQYATYSANTQLTRSATRACFHNCNRYGAFDMHGNVWEWCGDWYDRLPAGDVLGPVGPPRGSTRVIRGGSWNAVAANCLAAFRFRDDPTFRGNGIGFRLALSFVGVPGESGQDKNK
jgi:formylglycine-generating enzyme required for sulfatase activity